MTKAANLGPPTGDEIIEVETPAATVDLAHTGITHLRSLDESAMKLWSVRGPKGMADSTVSAVLLQGAEPPRIVMLHQFGGGKFKLFEPKAVAE